MSRLAKIAAMAVVLATSLTAPLAPAAARTAPADVALEWFDANALTVQLGGAPAPVTNNRVWAIGWLAAARALLRRPLAGTDYQEAALASAVHATLVAFAPPGKPQLDAVLATSLGRIPDGPAKEQGVAAGVAAAQSLLAARQGDGLDPASVNQPFELPAPAPGGYEATPPAYERAMQSGTRLATPFLLGRADRFRPTPISITSERYQRDLEEVRVLGAAGSTARTPAQTATAQFWLNTPLPIYTQLLRAALAQSAAWPLSARAGLVATFHVALVDTQIATSDAKYAHLRWRPVTALRRAGHDGWTPLHDTPPHPDFVSGHASFAGAAEVVLTALTGPGPAQPVTVTSPSAPGAPRTYTTWRQATLDNVDARVWSGIHTRNADEAGAALGRTVARHTLRTMISLLAG